ncbi:S-layer homology domain-containing protein [Paenibacillus sp. RC67]|uniref:S-layer homology domain-containing protein n=1 Tax=Paenibacillus sp. RC67 TaxID=3039392 RepID=UPI0024AC92E3|nr:S-layer homology domain-containing protein [Paenibacillus sp. RC67]
MKLRKFSIWVLIITVLCMSLVPITAAADSAVTLNAIPTVQPGGTVTIAGASTLNEVLIKVLRPGNSTVFYNIVKVTNGQFSDSFSIGSNEPTGTYTIIAGQADQVASQSFVVEGPTKPTDPTPTPSSNADLSGLTLSNGTISPAFASGTTSYSADVANDVSNMTVTATVSDSKATMEVNGAAVASGQASGAISLNVGANLINIEVTAENGAQKTYSVAVTREQSSTPPTGNKSSNADLSGLTLSSGTISPVFASGTTSYSADVANDVSNMTVTATLSDSKATMKVNGAAVASGAISLNVGANLINIVVTAENGTQKTYSVTVTRASAPSSGGGGRGGSSGSTSSSDTVTSTDGKLTIPVGKSGEVSLNDMVKIVIPADAFSKELQLTIEKVVDTQKLITIKDVLASPIYEILKNFSENFSKEITIIFTFDPKSVKGNQKPSVFYYDETKQIWVEVGGVVNGNTITIQVSHFTKYAVFAIDAKQTINFNDISGHWAEANIKQAVSAGIVSGYPDGTFKPNTTVTRAEFAVMLMNALKPEGEGAALKFEDAARIGTWAQKAVSQALQAGIISGYEDGSFRPDAEITRPEMAVMIAKALGQSIEATAGTSFTDDKDIPTWAKGAVAAMNKLGVIEGKGVNQFAPGDKTTRAEAVTVLLKMLAQKSK